jgi:hypothetical protein
MSAPDTAADQALDLARLYDEAAYKTPGGAVPLPEETRHRRASIVDCARRLGLSRLFECARDGMVGA